METFDLNVVFRDGTGKSVTRKLRTDALVPAVLYGHKKGPIGLSVQEPEIRAIIAKNPDSAVVNLTVGGEKSQHAMVREVQRHPATGEFLHVDFQRIDLDEKLTVDVPLEFLGDPKGVKEQGGRFEHTTQRTLSVLCVPTAIPKAIKIDISALEMDDKIRVEDIASGYPDLEFLDDPVTLLATVTTKIAMADVDEDGEGEEGAAAESEAPAAEEPAGE